MELSSFRIGDVPMGGTDRAVDISNLVALSPSPMAIVDPSTGTLVMLNSAAVEVFGAPAEQLVGASFTTLIDFNFATPSDTDSRTGYGVGRLCGGETNFDTIYLDYRFIDDPDELWVVAMFDYARVCRSLQDQIEASRTDATTGALRRDVFLQILTAYSQHPSQATYGVLFLDIDHFKEFNDNFGHHFGDRVLATVVKVLRGMLRGSDVIGRFGGDEFVVLLSGPLDFGDVERIACHVERRISSAVSDRVGATVHASVGGAFCTAMTSATQALVAADAAMYRAKRQQTTHEASAAVVEADQYFPPRSKTSHNLQLT